jgi:hypothetical protein
MRCDHRKMCCCLRSATLAMLVSGGRAANSAVQNVSIDEMGLIVNHRLYRRRRRRHQQKHDRHRPSIWDRDRHARQLLDEASRYDRYYNANWRIVANRWCGACRRFRRLHARSAGARRWVFGAKWHKPCAYTVSHGHHQTETEGDALGDGAAKVHPQFAMRT